jgi:hypothetical protein
MDNVDLNFDCTVNEAVLAANMLREAQHHRIPHVDIEGLQADETVRIHLWHNFIKHECYIN